MKKELNIEVDIRNKNDFFYMLKSWKRLQVMFPDQFLNIEAIFKGAEKNQIQLAINLNNFYLL